MKISELLIISSLFWLLACQENRKTSFNSEPISFSNDFSSYNLNYCIDSSGKEYVSFADFVTAKKITFHSLEKGEKWSVNLTDLMEAEKEKFIYYHTISPDSIILLTKYTNKLFLIDRKGTVLKKADYSRLLEKGIEFVPPLYFRNNLIYHAINNYPISDLQTTNGKEQEAWQKELLKKPMIAKSPINPDGSSPEYFGGNLISRFMRSDQMHAEGVHFYLNGKTVYYHSAYSDTLYTITEQGNKTLLKIKSMIGKISLVPSTMKEYKKNIDCINEAYLKSSFINSILFDNRKKLIYILIRKPKIDDRFPFNILVYNEHLKQLSEVEFDGTEHYANGFIGKKGFYLLKKFDQNPKQKSFDLFDYENY